MYIYKPKRFYIITFATTWFFWLFAIMFNDGLTNTLGMVLGGLCPATVAIITVFTSKSDALKKDFKRKIFNFWKLKPLYIFAAVLIFSAIVSCSILLSTAFGESLDQFSFTKDFSFTGVGVMSAFATIFLAAVLEEVGWRGYGEDAIAQHHLPSFYKLHAGKDCNDSDYKMCRNLSCSCCGNNNRAYKPRYVL